MQIRSCHFLKSSKVFLLGIKSKSSLPFSHPYMILFKTIFLTSFSAIVSHSYSIASTLTLCSSSNITNTPSSPRLYLLFTWHRIIFLLPSLKFLVAEPSSLWSDVISSEMALLMHTHHHHSLLPCLAFLFSSEHQLLPDISIC